MQETPLCPACSGLGKVPIHDWDKKLGNCIRLVECPACIGTGLDRLQLWRRTASFMEITESSLDEFRVMAAAA